MRILTPMILSTVLLVSGCTAIQQQARSSHKVMSASADERPEWLDATMREHDGYFYFMGHADRASDVSQGEDAAEAHARARIRAALKDEVSRAYCPSHDDSPHVHNFEKALSQQVSSLPLKGATPVRRYWERYELPAAGGTVYAYRVWMFVRIPKARFIEVKQQVQQAIAEAPRS